MHMHQLIKYHVEVTSIKRALGECTHASLVKWILRHLLMVCTQSTELVQPGSIPG